MKTSTRIVSLFVLIASISCNKVERTCDNLNLDFVYSIGYAPDSSYAEVSFTNTTNSKGSQQLTNWYINGAADRDSYENNSYKIGYATFNKNGNFSITMEVEEDGIECNVVKEFEITGIKDTVK